LFIFQHPCLAKIKEKAQDARKTEEGNDLGFFLSII